LEEGSEPENRCSLADTSFTMEATGEMVTDKDVTGLSIEAFVVDSSVLIFRLLSRESKVNPESLIRYSSSFGGIGSRRAFL
jgi:hypothetical protein